MTLAIVLAITAGTVAAQSASKKAGKAEAAASPEAVEPLGVGDQVPKSTVQNSAGEDVDLNALIAEQPTALIFYRGGWCPFCNRHLKEVAEMRDEIASAGYQIVAISADRPADVMKAEEKRDYPFVLLSDSDMSTARQFGVAFMLDEGTLKRYKGFGVNLVDTEGNAHNSLPVPTFYLVDPDGTITFAHYNPDYKVRISKEEIREAMKKN